VACPQGDCLHLRWVLHCQLVTAQRASLQRSRLTEPNMGLHAGEQEAAAHLSDVEEPRSGAWASTSLLSAAQNRA
jgi:hypothetical protein